MEWWELIVNEEFFEPWHERNEAYNLGLGFALITVIGLVRYRRLEAGQRRILLFAGYSMLMEYISTDQDWKTVFDTGGNTQLYHILTPGLFMAVLWVFLPVLSARARRLWWVLSVGFVVFAVLNATWLDSFGRFPTWTATTYGVTGMLLCGAYLLHLLRTLVVQRLENDPLFLFAAAGLIYYSGSVLFLVAMKHITYELHFFNRIYSVLRLLLFFFQIVLLIAVVVSPDKGAPPDNPPPASPALPV